MEDIKIKIKSKLINYDLNFEHNLNILRGDSATGKSTIVKFLDNEESSNAIIESNYELFHLNSKMLERNIKLDNKTIYIMDESDGIKNQIVINTINKNKYKFILIIRDAKLENLSYGINQIYELYKSGKYNLNRRIYKDNLNKDKLGLLNFEDFNSIVTEDSESGFQFYSNYKNFEVMSSNGNSNINNNIENNQIVVIDSIAFGPYIKQLLDLIDNKNIFIVSPKSFEWLILTSDIFRINNKDLDKNYKLINCNKNKEKYYEICLKEESSKINIRYSKSKLNEKFLEEKQFNKINDRIRNLFDIDINELNKVKNNNFNIDNMRWS